MARDRTETWPEMGLPGPARDRDLARVRDPNLAWVREKDPTAEASGGWQSRPPENSAGDLEGRSPSKTSEIGSKAHL